MMRFLENHKIVKTKLVETNSMSVDTYKDLDRVINIIKERK